MNDQYAPKTDTCPTCGNKDDFTWGVVGGAYFAASVFSLRTKQLRARQCNVCGNVQLFIKGFPARK